MDKYYLGLDCSSKAVHGSIINHDGVLQETIKWTSPIKDFDARFVAFLTNFYEELGIIVERYPSLWVAVEAPIFIQNPRTTMQIASVVYATKFICSLHGLNSILVQNKTWKKVTVGNGNATKSDILEYANKLWDTQFAEQDWADAACVALWCKKWYMELAMELAEEII
jgi:Holliday junction resolvasome RuvABC endonuclease subunit